MAANGLQLANTNNIARNAVITIMVILVTMGYVILLRWSIRIHVNAMAHLTIVEETKYNSSQYMMYSAARI